MKKTYQKHHSCHKAELSAGDKTTTNCPPGLIKSVKCALLDEIKNFNVRNAHKDAENSARGGPTLDAYTAWLEQHDGHEPVEANPDVLAEEDGIKFIPSTKDNKTVGLLAEVRQFFSTRELQVWNLVMCHSLSYQEAADILSISISTLRMYLKRANRKFTKFMEANRDEMSV